MQNIAAEVQRASRWKASGTKRDCVSLWTRRPRRAFARLWHFDDMVSRRRAAIRCRGRGARGCDGPPLTSRGRPPRVDYAAAAGIGPAGTSSLRPRSIRRLSPSSPWAPSRTRSFGSANTAAALPSGHRRRIARTQLRARARDRRDLETINAFRLDAQLLEQSAGNPVVLRCRISA
jgi:hypothetical protein